MARDVTDPQRPQLSLVQPAAAQPARFPVRARIRSRDGDELVDVQEIPSASCPSGRRPARCGC
jgi:hypothetical protein